MGAASLLAMRRWVRSPVLSSSRADPRSQRCQRFESRQRPWRRRLRVSLALTPLPVTVVQPGCWRHVLLIKSSRALLAACLLAQLCRFRGLDMETVPLRYLHRCRQNIGSSCRMAAVTIGTRLRRAKQDGKSGGVQMGLRSSTRLHFAPPLIFRRCGMMGPGPAVSERFRRRVVVVTGGSAGIDGAIPQR
jgi:hypothetical protein